MRVIRSLCLSIIAAGLVGCASAPVLQPARPLSAQNLQHALAPSKEVTQTSHTMKHLNPEQSIVYSQSFGGSLGVGLLLGPLGVAANVKMVDTQTDQDIAKIKGKLSLDPVLAFRQAANAAQFALQADAKPADVRVTPYLLVSKTSETALHVSSMLVIESPEGADKWVRRYRVQLPGKYTLDELAALDGARLANLQGEAVKAYTAVLAQMAGESDAAVAKERPIKMTSEYLTPRFPFEQQASLIREEADRVWVRTVAGVVALAPAEIQYKLL